MTIAVTSVGLGDRIWSRFRGESAVRFDYRFVALGALIPDLIDKPLAWYLFPSLPDDHLWGHTLLLPTLLILLGAVRVRRGDPSLFSLGLGCLTHPLFDPINQYPQTLFWPLLGTEFPAAETNRKAMQVTLETSLVVTCALLLSRGWFRDLFRRVLANGAP